MSNMPCFTTPEQLYDACLSCHKMMASRRGTLSPCSCRILSRLNHFNFRLRPASLRTSCLTFGVTSACPMLAIRWLTYLAGTGFPPAGIIDLARPHTPLISLTPLISFYPGKNICRLQLEDSISHITGWLNASNGSTSGQSGPMNPVVRFVLLVNFCLTIYECHYSYSASACDALPQ